MNEREAPNPLTQVMRGMQVYDANGDLIGEVDHISAGALRQGGGHVPLSEAEGEDHIIVDAAFPEILDPNQLPAELVDRMLQEGYISVSRPGLEDIGTIILPDQIDSVSEQGIYLIP